MKRFLPTCMLVPLMLVCAAFAFAGGATARTRARSQTGRMAIRVSDPLRGARFYVNPWDEAVAEEKTLSAEGNAAAAQIEKIAAQPEGMWLTDADQAANVEGTMKLAAASHTVPVFVLYDIPWRDCGSYSSGGAGSASAYRSYVDTIVRGLGQGRAVVIVEPDALSEVSCLSAAKRRTYYSLIGYATRHLDRDPRASVYVDAGNPIWQPPATEASELRRVLGRARAGFSVDVASFYPTATDIAYGTAISRATGGRHFVVDTSRNGGRIVTGQWCNPAGAHVGTDPTTDTGNALVDALLWVKDPGESDGTCNGGPTSGQFFLRYALNLVA